MTSNVDPVFDDEARSNIDNFSRLVESNARFEDIASYVIKLRRCPLLDALYMDPRNESAKVRVKNFFNEHKSTTWSLPTNFVAQFIEIANVAKAKRTNNSGAK